MDKRLKKMTAIFFLAAAADLFLAAVLLASLARQRAEGAAAPGTGRVVEDGGWDGPGTEEAGAVALTFDDDVIIGLSQEISYKEAVSMI
mgnify:CR=1 FL=1